MSATIQLAIQKKSQVDLSIPKTKDIKLGIRSAGGASDYAMLTGLPTINGETVIGDKLGEDYNLQNIMAEITPQDIDNIIFGG